MPPIAPPQQPQPPQAGAPPGAQPGQPPMASSPATQPSQNKGHQVAAQKLMGMALMIMEQAVPLAGAATPEGGSILSAIKLIAKHVPPGSVTPADIQNVAQAVLLKSRQGQQQMQQMQAQQAQPQQQQQPPGGGAAPMPRAA